MTNKSQSIELAYKLVTTTNISIDMILKECDITHAQYRRLYPDTIITPSLALDILDARDIDGLTNKQIKRKWNLSNSQLHYALYNDNAIITKEDPLESVRDCIITALRLPKPKSQTDIAEEYGVSQSFVHKIAKEIGALPKRKKRVVLTEQQWEDIIVKSKTVQIEQLAKEYGVSRDTIYKGLRSMR